MAVRKSTKMDAMVGRAITQRRCILGMTMPELAALVGVSQQQIHKYEHGTNRISAGRLYAIAKALSCQPDDLYPGLDDVEPLRLNSRGLAFMRLAAALPLDKLQTLRAATRNLLP